MGRGRTTFAAALLASALPFAAARAGEVCDALVLPADAGGPRLGDGVSGVATFSAGAAKDAVRPRAVVLGPLDRAQLRAEEERRRSRERGGLARFGVRRGVPSLAAPRRLAPGARGVHETPDGGRVWVGEVAAPGASGLRLAFTRFDLPPGATVTLHDADEPSESYGPFASRGPGPDGAWHAPTVFGDRVRVELALPAEVADAPVALAVRSALDLWSDVRPRRSFRAAECPHVDLACDPTAYAATSRAHALMIFAGGGGCSGALVNQQSGTPSFPWFLTAHHCVSTDSVAAGIEFYFDDHAADCGGSAPSLASLPRASGAAVVTTSQPSDVTLLRITGTMPSGRTYLGWNAAGVALGATATGVHHPALDPAKVSRGVVVQQHTYMTLVDWSSGYVEPGSSGSPLLDASQRVVGQLWGGELPWCGSSVRAYYGRMEQSWVFLQPYLAPEPGPPPGGGGGGGGGPTPPPPPGPPLEFWWGLWNRAALGEGEYRLWSAYLFPAPLFARNPRFDVRLKGARGTWVRLRDPKGTLHEIHRRTKLPAPAAGTWTVELHAAPEARRRLVGVRIAKNF